MATPERERSAEGVARLIFAPCFDKRTEFADQVTINARGNRLLKLEASNGQGQPTHFEIEYGDRKGYPLVTLWIRGLNQTTEYQMQSEFQMVKRVHGQGYHQEADFSDTELEMIAEQLQDAAPDRV